MTRLNNGMKLPVGVQDVLSFDTNLILRGYEATYFKEISMKHDRYDWFDIKEDVNEDKPSINTGDAVDIDGISESEIDAQLQQQKILSIL